MLLTDYFPADNDHQAVLALDEDLPAVAVYGNGLEPVVQLGQLESILTGASLDEIFERPHSGRLVAGTNLEEGSLVLSVSDDVRDAAARLPLGDYSQVAMLWQQCEELEGWDVVSLERFLGEFSALAQHAQESNQHLYCLLSL